ncbi:hypothetical protein ACZ90_01880 [Streptomyces albus subsp. albus]|nr:hypothetical protein ACZ90_01880 [Streptomyces albus subsp. albus]
MPAPESLPAARTPLVERIPRLLHPGGHGSAHPFRNDLVLAALVLVAQTTVAAKAGGDQGEHPDLLGWILLWASVLPLPWRRRAPLPTLIAVLVMVVPYQAIGYVHIAAVCAALIALYTVAAAGPPKRTAIVVGCVFTLVAVVMLLTPEHSTDGDSDMLRSLGWVVAFPAFGEVVRIHRRYVAAIVERAERAERSREEEAARRVAEERLRIARDLHDLLAHSITLIGVQTSVAAHVLIADPDKLDRAALAAALDGIADTCRDARAELRTTLGVLRTGEGAADAPDPLPNLDGLLELARIARAGGARVDLTVRLDGPADAGPDHGRPGHGSPDRPTRGSSDGDPLAGPAPDALPGGAVAVPAAIGAAAYRIVQESLTNAVRHAGPEVRVRVAVGVEQAPAGRTLRVTVTDSGPGPATAPGRGTADPDRPAAASGTARPKASAGAGFGIAGMRERARTVGGTLETTAHPRGGFTVTAALPLDGRPQQEEPR